MQTSKQKNPGAWQIFTLSIIAEREVVEQREKLKVAIILRFGGKN
jgi:hypothetical protein